MVESIELPEFIFCLSGRPGPGTIFSMSHEHCDCRRAGAALHDHLVCAQSLLNWGPCVDGREDARFADNIGRAWARPRIVGLHRVRG